MLLHVLAICAGASIGALCRWCLSLWLTTTAFPYGTLASNLIGGYLIGVAVAVFQAMPQLDPAWRLLLITGFLGGLTTFSSFSAEVVAMLMNERLAWPSVPLRCTSAGSLVLTWLGIRTVQQFTA